MQTTVTESRPVIAWEEDWLEEQIIKQLRETFGNDENAHHLDCSDEFTGTCMSKFIKFHT